MEGHQHTFWHPWVHNLVISNKPAKKFLDEFENLKFEVQVNSKILKGMIHFHVQVMFHETMWDMYPFLNNVGSTVTEIIWNFDHKFMDPNYVTTSFRRTIRAFYDIIWIMIV
jgi:hypothetical protein